MTSKCPPTCGIHDNDKYLLSYRCSRPGVNVLKRLASTTGKTEQELFLLHGSVVSVVYVMTREKGELQWAGGNERRFVKDYKKYPCEQVLRGTCNQIICTKHEE